MWELAFNIPIPNLTGLVSGFCLGVTIGTAVCIGLGIHWGRESDNMKLQEEGTISFEDIENLTTDD